MYASVYPQYGFGNIISDLANSAADIYNAFNTDANPSPVSSTPHTYPYNAYPYGGASVPYGVMPAVDAYGNPINYNAGNPVRPAFWDNYYYGSASGSTVSNAGGLSSTAVVIGLLALAYLLLK